MDFPSPEMAMELVQGVIGFFLGISLHYLFVSKRIDKLTNQVESLVGVISKLEAKLEGIEILRRDLFELEKRVSNNEAFIELLKEGKVYEYSQHTKEEK